MEYRERILKNMSEFVDLITDKYDKVYVVNNVAINNSIRCNIFNNDYLITLYFSPDIDVNSGWWVARIEFYSCSKDFMNVEQVYWFKTKSNNGRYCYTTDGVGRYIYDAMKNLIDNIIKNFDNVIDILVLDIINNIGNISKDITLVNFPRVG